MSESGQFLAHNKALPFNRIDHDDCSSRKGAFLCPSTLYFKELVCIVVDAVLFPKGYLLMRKMDWNSLKKYNKKTIRSKNG